MAVNYSSSNNRESIKRSARTLGYRSPPLRYAKKIGEKSVAAASNLLIDRAKNPAWPLDTRLCHVVFDRTLVFLACPARKR